MDKISNALLSKTPQRQDKEDKIQKWINGFTSIPNWIIETGIWAKLSPKAKSLYIPLRSHANYTIRVGCLTIPKLKEEVGLSKGYIPEAKKELEDKGLIKTWRKGFMWFYKVVDIKPEGKYPQYADTYPSEGVSIRKTRTHTLRQKGNGRFTCPQNTDTVIPQNTDTYHCPHNTDTKENQEYNKDNREGSSSACLNSQASPSFKNQENPKNELVRKNQEQIRALLKNKGVEESMGVLCGQGLTHSEAYNTILEFRLAEERY